MNPTDRNRFALIGPQRGDVVDEHSCPSCGAAVLQRYRPGRARIYCNNACRQRAYRWRRANGVRLCVERNGPAERSITFDRRHALRDERDPAASIVDRRRRRVSVCGTFSRPASLGRFTHHDFLVDHDWSCESCISLIGAPDTKHGRLR